MDETIGLTAIIGLIGYFLRLTFMPEVRTVRKILGDKSVCLEIQPRKIENFYSHNQNRAPCIDFFYRRTAISVSYYSCLTLTIVTLLFGLPTFLSGLENPFQQAPNQSIQNPEKQIQQFDTTEISKTTILVVKQDGTYTKRQLPVFAELTIITPEGNIVPLFGGYNIFFAFLFFGLLLALICSVLVGPLRKPGN